MKKGLSNFFFVLYGLLIVAVIVWGVHSLRTYKALVVEEREATYAEATALYEEGRYGEAMVKFWDLTQFMDSVWEDRTTPNEYIELCQKKIDDTMVYCPYCDHPIAGVRR